MASIAMDTRVGQVSAELAGRGLAAETRVRVIVEVVDASDDLPMTRIVEEGGAFDWLADEPDIYTDADVIAPASPRARSGTRPPAGAD